MKITLISAVAGIPTIYPFEGYGGIERIVADLSHEFATRGYDVRLIAGNGSRINGVNVIEVNDESDIRGVNARDDDVVFDFSHSKSYPHVKYSIPMYSDNVNGTPIYPTNAVRRTFGVPGRVIYPGIDISKYYSSDKRGYYIVLSRLAHYKGIDIAITIARRLNVKLIIAGHDGPFAVTGYAKFLKDKLQESEYDNGKIIIEENVTEERKRELLSHASGMIFLPDWRSVTLKSNAIESFGIVVVEALASGCPVITHSEGGQAEIIDENTGVIANEWEINADLIREKIFTPSEQACIERAKYFSIQRYADRLLEYTTVSK